jgi:hypothetical protein
MTVRSLMKQSKIQDPLRLTPIHYDMFVKGRGQKGIVGRQHR